MYSFSVVYFGGQASPAVGFRLMKGMMGMWSKRSVFITCEKATRALNCLQKSNGVVFDEISL